MDLTSSKLGRDVKSRSILIAKVMKSIDTIDFELENTEIDVLGDAYEYLIGQFAAGSGKKAGEFYTPQQASTILSRIVTLDCQDPATGSKRELRSGLDMTCGSGSLLLNVNNQMRQNGGKIGKI